MPGTNDLIEKIGISILFITLAIVCKSQTTEILCLSADRPGISTSPDIVPAKYFQIETGYSFEKMKTENSLIKTTLFNSTLLRYGINKISEIRVQTDYAKVKTDGDAVTGFNPLTIGTKLLIAEEKNFIPKTSFLLNLTLPFFGEKEFRPKYMTPSFYLLMQNDITAKLNIGYNIGIEYDDTGTAPKKFVAICFNYNFTDRLWGYLESYNWFSDNIKPENYTDCGFAYFLKKNIQLDLSGNMNLHEFKEYYMIIFGISWIISNEK
jgi:hypothetical protein